MTAFLRMAGLLAALGTLLTAGAGRAEVVSKPGQLIVEDKGNLFSDVGINKAKDEFARLHSKTGRQVMVETLAKLPDADKARLDRIDKKDRAAVRRFWSDFTQAEAKADRAKGIYILICRSPGHVHVLADREMRNKGFDSGKENQLADDLLRAMRESAKEKSEADKTAAHDKALLSAVEYLERNLPGESADLKRETKPTSTGSRTETRTEPHRGNGMGIGGWICLIIAILLGVWLVTGLIRAFSGGGGYGGGGPGYGGGWGGGFFPSLMGGLFGAAAGMWMYDHFMGGHSSSAYAGDGGAGGDTGPTVDDTGAGDFSGDEGAGGDFGDGADGGGDLGGGGGDLGGGGFFGGGGDFGGGGGDFGGGGGDF